MFDIATSTLQQAHAPRRQSVRRAQLQSPHCCVLVEARYLVHAQPAGMMLALQRSGCSVSVTDPDDSLLDFADCRWLEGVDLVVARGRSTDLLTRLSAAEAAGVPTLNPRHAISGVVDKAHMAARLLANGIPTPPTWIGRIEQVRQKVPDTAFPLILKPVFGDNCRGIEVVHTRAQLAQLAWAEPCVIAQRLLPSDGFDIKLYAIGEQVWAVRKPSALLAQPGAATLLALPAAWRELALRCGAAFGLRLFGVDCIEHAGGLAVIEVNDFPNYTGVPEADDLLALHIQNEIHAHAKGPQ